MATIISCTCGAAIGQETQGGARRNHRRVSTAAAKPASAAAAHAHHVVPSLAHQRNGSLSSRRVNATFPAPHRSIRRGATLSVRSRYSGGGGGGGVVPSPDRVLSLIPYLLPLSSGLRYARFFFTQFPAAVVLVQPILPLVTMMHQLPFGSLILFFGIYLGIAKNQSLSRFCRFNAMQAILLDICLIFPSLIEGEPVKNHDATWYASAHPLSLSLCFSFSARRFHSTQRCWIWYPAPRASFAVERNLDHPSRRHFVERRGVFIRLHHSYAHRE